MDPVAERMAHVLDTMDFSPSSFDEYGGLADGRPVTPKKGSESRRGACFLDEDAADLPEEKGAAVERKRAKAPDGSRHTVAATLKPLAEEK